MSDSEDKALAKNFGRYEGEQYLLTHLKLDGDEEVRIRLQERVGRQVWVRRLDDGEAAPDEPVVVSAGDIVVPFTPVHSTSINTTPVIGDSTGFVIGLPVIERRRDDEAKAVFIRTRRVGEPMPVERVRVPYGYAATMNAGDLVLELEWIDQMLPPDEDGYAPLTNTIWTWMTIGAVPGVETLTRYLLAAARRLDAAQRSFQRIRKQLDAFDSAGPGPHTRLAVFEIVGDVETTVIALSRAIDMAIQVGTLAPITTPVPESLLTVAPGLSKIRNAYEHIEDRAKGNVNRKPDPQQALTIFDWTTLFDDNAITYARERLELSTVPRTARRHP